LGATALGEQLIDENKNTAYVLGFANGLRLNSMSSNPDAQAGKRGDRVLDEFALHPDPRKLYSIAYPGHYLGRVAGNIFHAPRQRQFLQRTDPGD
jgi:phage FluMu gp28-like protein